MDPGSIPGTSTEIRAGNLLRLPAFRLSVVGERIIFI